MPRSDAGPDGRFFGKYRGRVVSADDPLHLGRVRVEAPAVLGDGRDSWALPCVPYAGPQVGLISPPPPGANVWVEFEAGDPDFPIWSGCFWGPNELPRTTEPGSTVLRVGGVTLVSGASAAVGRGVEPARRAPGSPVTEVTLTATGFTLSRGGQQVVSVDDEQVSVELAGMRIAVSAGPGPAISLEQGGSALKITPQAVTATQGPAAVEVAGDKVSVTNGPTAVKVSLTQVQLSSGAGSVTIGPATVNLNNGALEVL